MGPSLQHWSFLLIQVSFLSYTQFLRIVRVIRFLCFLVCYIIPFSV